MKPNNKQKEDNKWEETTERFIVFLDILGFKDRVARQAHEKVLKDLSKLSNAAEQCSNFDNVNYLVVQFSDSFFILSKDNGSR